MKELFFHSKENFNKNDENNRYKYNENDSKKIIKRDVAAITTQKLK